MKIVHVEVHYPPELGYQINYIGKWQARLGHDVHIVTSVAKWPNLPQLNAGYRSVDNRRLCTPGSHTDDDGVRIHRLPMVVEYRAFCMMKGLAGMLANLKPDVVHVHSLLYNPAVWTAAMLKDQTGYRLVVDSHVADYNSSVTNSLAKRVYFVLVDKPWIRYVVDKTDALVAIGPAERVMLSRLTGIPEGSIPIIPLGSDTQLFSPDVVGRDMIRAQLGLSDSDVLAVKVGKINEGSDLETAFEAIAKANASGVRLFYMLIGGSTPEYVTSLEQEAEVLGIRDKLLFIKPQKRPDLPRWLAAADIGLWPGGPSVSAIDAICCGLPVILSSDAAAGSDEGDLARWGNGLVVTRGNVDLLADALVTLGHEGSLREEMKKAAINARTELDWQFHARRFLDMYAGR